MTRILTIASGGAGVGKTSLAINLAARLSARGQRVCLFDAGPREGGAAGSLADIPARTLFDVIARPQTDKALPVIPHSAGFDVIPGGFDRERMTHLGADRIAGIAALLSAYEDYDIVLVDATSSLVQGLLAFVLASPELLLVLTTEPESLSDAYSLLKLLFSEDYEGDIKIVINKAKNHEVGQHSYDKLREVADFYLNMQMPLCGIIDEELALVDADACLMDAEAAPSQALRDIDALAGRLLAAAPDATRIDAYREDYLRAAGVTGTDNDADDTELMSDTHPSFASEDALYQQLEFLSAQVDSLISEVERLRSEDNSHGPVATIPRQPVLEEAELYELRPAAMDQAEPCSAACIAALASDSETVTVLGETFPIYQIQQADGRRQRFAFQTIDDDLEAPEPKTTSS